MFTCTSTSTSTNKYVHDYMCVYGYVSSYKKDLQSISHVRNNAITFYLAKELRMRSSVYFIFRMRSSCHRWWNISFPYVFLNSIWKADVFPAVFSVCLWVPVQFIFCVDRCDYRSPRISHSHTFIIQLSFYQNFWLWKQNMFPPGSNRELSMC